MDLFLTNTQLFASQDIIWWTGVLWITCALLWCFYQLFGLSFWRHPFTAEDPFLSKWCSATFLQIWWGNKLIYIFDGLRVSKLSANFHFWVNYSFNSCHSCSVWEFLYFAWCICYIFSLSAHTDSFRLAPNRKL